MKVKYHLVSVWSGETGQRAFLVPVNADEDRERQNAKESFRVDKDGLMEQLPKLSHGCLIAIGR